MEQMSHHLADNRHESFRRKKSSYRNWLTMSCRRIRPTRFSPAFSTSLGDVLEDAESATG